MNIDELQADAFSEGEHSLKRELGPLNLVSLGRAFGFNGIIAAGGVIFFA
jgi:hypothetical protein